MHVIYTVPAASFPLSSRVQVRGAGWEEVNPFSTQRGKELGRGPELLFPLAVQRTEAEYVLALKTAWHFSCINASYSTLNITPRSGFSAECMGSYVTLSDQLTLLLKQTWSSV